MLILTALVVLIGTNHLLLNHLQKKWDKEISFTFSLPFPDDIIKRYSLTNSLQIEKVIIAGPFSDWNGNNEQYRMTKLNDHSWNIQFRLPPGPSQYKYVVHTREKVFDKKDKESRNQIWVHDMNCRKNLPDSFGGYNSVMKVPDIPEIRRVSNIILFGMGLILLLYLVLKPIMRRIMMINRSYRFKLVLITGIILLTSNILFIVYNIVELRIISHQAYIDSSHFLLKPLLPFFADSQKYNTQDLNRLQSDIDALLDDTFTRNEKNKFSLNQFNISSVMILDTNFNTLVFSIRNPSEKLQSLLLRDTTYPSVKSLFRDFYYKDMVEKLKRESNPFQQPSFGLARFLYNPERPSIGDVSRLFIGFDTMVIPVKIKNAIRYYAFFSLHTDLLGMEVQRILGFNVIILLSVIVLMFFLLYDMGGILSHELRKLLRGIDEVMQGNLEYHIKIRTQDEFESLGEAYNNMRLSIRDLKQNLEQKVEERTESLNQALSKLNQANIQLEEQAKIDGLTQVFNRRSLDEILDYEVMRSRRVKQFLGILLLDLDHFKRVNDKRGHQAGDQVLQKTTQAVRNCLSRATDEMGRYGGEEFCIILPSTDEEGVAQVAEQIRKAVEDQDIEWEGQKIKISTSIGSYSSVPEKDFTKETYYKRADQALYLAKKNGRNRVEKWDHDVEI